MIFLSKTILTLFCSALLFQGYTQVETPREELTAADHIGRLKGGTLLVRLQTREDAILLLEMKGNKKKADDLWREQKRKNDEIISAFEYIFDFCPVLFFFSYDSDKVRNREFDGIFVNRDMRVDSTLAPDPSKPVYTAEIGEVYFKVFSQHMKGGVIMDDQFRQLTKPFPYLVRKRSGLTIIKRSNTEIVEEMNKGLHEFYNKTIGE